jgi:hypothetical protein
MKDLTGHNVKALKGPLRFIRVSGDEALVVERIKDALTLYVCDLEAGMVRTFCGFEGVSKEELLNFLVEPLRGKKLVRGLRIGPMFKKKQVRRLVILKKPQNDSFFVKIEPLSVADAGWQHNGSGWVPVTNLSHRAPGLMVFIRGIEKKDLIDIEPRYTKQGIFFLKESFEIYVEHVKESFAFGKLVLRGT